MTIETIRQQRNAQLTKRMASKKLFGDDSKEDTPVPIPNTVVKLFSADGSWGFPPVRVGRCQAIYHVIYA